MSVELDESVGADRHDAGSQLRRRDVSQTVRAVRERLTAGGLRPDVQIDLLQQFARNRVGAALPALVMLAAIAMLATLWTSPGFVAAWLLAAMTALACTMALARRYLAAPVDIETQGRWRRRFAAGETLWSTAWALLGLHLATIEAPAVHVFVLFLMLLVVAMSVMLSAPLPLAMLLGFVPVGVVVAVLATLDRSVATSAVAIMASSAMGYFLLLGLRLHNAALQTLEFRAEKDVLIAELEQAKSNSDDARWRAEEANLAKSRFLATMSHELRTPLNAILGFSEVMKSEVFGPLTVPNYREYVSDIHNSGQHLLNLINEILDLSRIEAGRYELTEEQVGLAGVAEECQHLLKLRAKAKGIVIAEAYEAGMPPLWADERAVRQIVLNLLSNAIKFTPQGGEVALKAGWTRQGGQYLAVRDNGPGIPEEEMSTVLSSFGRGSFAIKTAEQGSGLGLPIVKGLVDLHGGRFTLKSKLREGTEAVVIFPAERVMQPLAPIVDGRTPAARSSRAA